jgi:hypothetical protein
MLLNRGDILGVPNANPLGSDNSFLKYDEHFKKYLTINLDVKTTKANENINDILGSSPIGNNQNSYSSNIQYSEKDEIVELRKYEPGLKTTYDIVDQHTRKNSYINLTYSVVILYCELPTDKDDPQEQRVICVFVNCIPNGELYQVYGDEVIGAGKTSELHIIKGEKIFYNEKKRFLYF